MTFRSCAAAVLCAVVTLATIFAAPVPYWNDALIYLSLGEHIARGEGYTSSLYIFHDFIQPPLFPLLIAAFSLVMRPLAAAIVVVVLSSVGTMFALQRIHRMLWGERGQWLVVLCACVFPMHATSSLLVTEPTFVCLSLWGVAFTLQGLSRARRRDLAIGALLVGLSILTRPEGIFTTGVLAVLLAAAAGDVRARATRVAILLGIVACVLVPYGLFVQAHIGYFTVLPKLRYNAPLFDTLARMDWPADEKDLMARDLRVHDTLLADNETLVFRHKFLHPDFDVSPYFPLKPAASTSKLAEIFGASKKVVWTTVKAFGPWNPLAFVFLAAGLVRALRREGETPRSLRLAVLALVGAYLAGPLSSDINFEYRFLLPSTFTSLVLVGGGFAPIHDWLAKRTRFGWVPAALLVASYAVLLAAAIPRVAGAPARRAHIRELGDACVANIPRGSRILSLNARCSFLTGSDFVILPYVETGAALDEYIAKHGVDHVELDVDLWSGIPGAAIQRYVDPATWPPHWRLVKEIPGPRRAFLVRVDGR